MQPQEYDRPKVDLILSEDGLKILWGPSKGPWGFYSDKRPPEQRTVKRWELHVGRKADPAQPDDPDEPIGNELFQHGKNGPPTDTTEIFIPKKDLLASQIHANEQILARVIGFFDLLDEKGQPIYKNKQIIEEGIYSDVARIVMDNGKAQMSSAS